uniref:Proteasome activator PA28 C-terminal domain-containing protein n=1 Tax=Arcella intermedia TaxID=1963864 RepID=A0A6B2LID4_9EUKA
MKIPLKKETTIMVEHATILKLWIQLNIPRIEDGNNFGVQVQEDMLTNLIKAEENAFAATDYLAKYHHARAKLIVKASKNPEVEDYIQTIHELDEKCYADMLMTLRDLRNNYAVLYDTLSKNLDKIQKPRSSHTSAMF